jgi:tetratricopeptide (TPR) repeat protein
MRQTCFGILCLVVFLCYSPAVKACTIFLVNDGHTVWIGNNEDERADTKYRFWYYPKVKDAAGYMVWAELSLGKLLNRFAYKNPQGGLNEYGLFMDYTAIDEVPVLKDPNKQDRKRELVHDVLKNCKTVAEALAYINKYNLIKLKAAQLFIADASGDYATIHGSFVARKSSKHFALTNYCIKDGHQEACYRRDIAIKSMNAKERFTLPDIKKILEQSAQKQPQTLVTNYSMAINLAEARVHLYQKNDFTTERIIELRKELGEAKHQKDIDAYFPADIAVLIEQQYVKTNIKEAVNLYTTLRQTAANQYNFSNNSVINLAVKWISDNKAADAIELLEAVKLLDTTKIEVYTWLGVAYKRINNIEQSSKNFTVALARNPDDYLANLWGKQVGGKIVFKLPDFAGAEKVSLIGDFTQGRKNAIAMKRVGDIWFCEAVLPQGEITYKFWVNNENLTDKINTLHTGSGAYTFSKLYVW